MKGTVPVSQLRVGRALILLVLLTLGLLVGITVVLSNRTEFGVVLGARLLVV